MIPFSEYTPVIDSISNLEHVEQSLNVKSNSNRLAGIFNSFVNPPVVSYIFLSPVCTHLFAFYCFQSIPLS